ncbi:hypothetical protein ACHAWF_016616 [Thalassiosira exigua]
MLPRVMATGACRITLPWTVLFACVLAQKQHLARARGQDSNADSAPSTAPFTSPASSDPFAPKPALIPTLNGGISGYGFFDSDDDGVRDPASSPDHDMSGISIYLFTCQNVILRTTKTDDEGFYSFEDLGAGRYYIIVNKPSAVPSYEFTGIWNGDTDECSGLPLHPDVDSAVDPKTGISACFDVVEGETEKVNFGLTLPMETSRAPTTKPTGCPTVSPTSTSPSLSPTSSPSEVVTSYPSDEPSTFPSGQPSTSPTTTEPSAKPTAGPSKSPTAISSGPSESPTVITTPKPIEATDNPTVQPTDALPAPSPLSAIPTKAPSVAALPLNPQSQMNEEGQFIMKIYGIQQLGAGDASSERAWSGTTSQYIVDYFNDPSRAERDVADVTVEIQVLKQSSSNKTLFGRQRQLQSGKYVEVTYNQQSSFKTADPAEYNGTYVATHPFEASGGAERYIFTLQSLSSQYNDVTSIDPVQVYEGDENIPAANQASEDDNQGSEGADPVTEDGNQESGGGSGVNTIAIVVGAVCASAALVAAFVINTYRRRQVKSDEYMTPVGNGPPSSMRRAIDRDLEGGTSSNPTVGSEVIVHIIAPAGRLGVVLDTPPEGGPAHVCKIKDSSPIIGEIKMQDKIVALDDEDVQQITAVNICRMLGEKSMNAQRKITVLREADGSLERR